MFFNLQISVNNVDGVFQDFTNAQEKCGASPFVHVLDRVVDPRHATVSFGPRKSKLCTHVLFLGNVFAQNIVP